MKLNYNELSEPGLVVISGAPEGFDALILGAFAASGAVRDLLHIARDDARMALMAEALAFFAPGVEVLTLPAWDCLPYDRMSPNGDVVSRRIDTLSRLAAGRTPCRPADLAPPKATPKARVVPACRSGTAGRRRACRIVLTTVNACLQRMPPREMFADSTWRAHVGKTLSRDELLGFLTRNGYSRTETVREPGEYAVRGGIIDIFPPGSREPLRLDLFGEALDGVRSFDPLSQRSTGKRQAITLKPVSEILLDGATISRFRMGYRELFGAVAGHDPLYEAISAGRRHMGMEHWLPLFHERLETVFDYLPEAAVTLDHQAEEAVGTRFDLIAEHYQARGSLAGRGGAAADGAIYKPLPPDRLYLGRKEWKALIGRRAAGFFSPFAAPEGEARTVDAGGKRGRDFADARVRADVNLFDAVGRTIAEERAAGRRVIITAYSAGARDRLHGLLRDHGVAELVIVDSWPDVVSLPPAAAALVVLALEHGFQTPEATVITEQDILGERLTRAVRRRRRAENFIQEASSLNQGDLVVHVEHGIGRYDGLETLEVSGAPHDCLRLAYDGGDRLYVPVENIEMLSRYGSETSGVQLDRLGSAHWQARKARVKKRIKDIAERLIRVAAERHLRTAPVMAPPEGLYDEFCARFPYPETEDQLKSIEDTLEDLSNGRPMDRLICGDVGFGKTEVALRAAFIAVMSGAQVAVVVPTTLLSRQHYQTFHERFAALPVRIEQLSRLVSAGRAAAVKRGLAEGTVDIVIGTHALLGKTIRFKNLGLVVVDEEQHFGVAQKERLKELESDVHVLTLTATPIPRTLQMALTGVREMSLIATPPVDRLAVRTFVLPYDPVVVREAILREHRRGGQAFYVCPRIEDLPRLGQRLEELVPEVKIATVHGRMAAGKLERIMAGFYDRAYDLLLSTNIIESGLDIPSVNTMIVHRADMFGLAQLYQLRGRIGRSKVRAYAYLTLPSHDVLSATARRRLDVMQTLDSLGAGFSLASYDLDIRGAGNLLGDEQSGHIREVGIELYQQLLEEAVARGREEGRGADGGAPAAEEWSPQINIGTPVLIPDGYVADLGVRLGLYRRIAELVDQAEIEAFAAELIDRFGPLPGEVENLLKVVAIKRLCLQAGIDRLEAGPKGAVVSFRLNRFANPEGLVDFMSSEAQRVKMRSDHKLVYRHDWSEPERRFAGIERLMRRLAEIAAKAAPRRPVSGS